MNEAVKLSKKDRQDRILTELRVSTTIRISDLAAELGVSYETIRRDLEEMGQSGLINRTYGGAVVRPFGFEPAWNERFNAMTEEREKIAATAAGSTTLHFARRLAAEAKNLTIVTNCFAVAMAFSTNPTITVLACPGQYDAHEGSVTGPDTINYLSRFNANRAVIGASGITREGPNDVDSSAAAIKRAMLQRAQEHILLIDHSKFEMPNLEVVCPLTEIHRVVTNQAPPPQLGEALGKARVEILY
jgi:DeoR/GlpR family transcriptional regulator of sugar metabolism